MECGSKTLCKNISKIRNDTFVLRNLKHIVQKRKYKIEKIHVDSEKSINLFEMKKNKLPDSLLDN